MSIIWKCILMENVEFVWLWLKSLCDWIEKIIDAGIPVSLICWNLLFLTEVKNKILFCVFQNLSTLTELSERFEWWGILLHRPEGPESCGCKARRAEFLVGKHVLYLCTLRIGVSWALWVTEHYSEKQTKSLFPNKVIGSSQVWMNSWEENTSSVVRVKVAWYLE